MTDSNSPENPFEGHLEEGERILWQGKPHKETFVNRLQIRRLGAGLIVLVATIVLILLLQSLAALAAALLLGLIFVSAAGIPYDSSKTADRLLYALTDRRILQWDGKRLAAKDIAELEEVKLKSRHSGIGDIIFGSLSHPFKPDRIGFYCIGDAERVHKQILELKEKLEKADS